MLQEVTGVPIKAVPGAARRRWFQDEEMDLMVWYDEAGEILGFQLCYDRGHDERALTWKRRAELRHDRVDSGEDEHQRNATPILVADGICQYGVLAARFEERSAEIEPEVGVLVLDQLRGAARD